MGRHHMKGRSEYHLMARWPVATALIRYKSLARNIPWICVARRRNLEKRHFGRRHWGIGPDGRIWNLREKTQCKESVNANEWWKVYIPNRRWNGKTLWRSSGSENIHLNLGPPRPRRENKEIFDENQTDLLQTRFETRRGMMVKLGMVSGPFQANLVFTVITWNPQSNCTCREKTQLKYTDVTRTTDTSLDVMLEKNVNDYWNVDGDRELSETWTGFRRFTVLNEKQPTNDLQARHFVARDLGRYVWCVETQRKAKVGYRETKDCVVSTSLILMMKNSRISWKMREESWTFRCQPQCLANFNVRRTGKPVALKKTRQNTLALLKLMNILGHAWKDLLTRITNIKLH